MVYYNRNLAVILITILMVFVSCTKKYGESVDEKSTVSWVHKGITYTRHAAIIDTTNNDVQLNSLEIYDTDYRNDIRFVISSINKAVYPISDSGIGNIFVLSYQRTIDSFLIAIADSGSITVTTNDKQRASGVFNVRVDGEQVNGQFYNVIIGKAL